MRTLLIIALAATLVGCSRQPPHQAATPAALQVRHRAAHFITKAKPARTKTEATATRIPPPPPSSRTQIEPKSGVAESRTIQEQVVAATGVAERMTVAALAPARDDVKRDLLVAVVMARPEIKSVPDLAGQRVAIDERHLASSGNVFVAFVLAGAASVEVSARHTAAIDRLINGEVTAAVLALVSADAAEAFPEIAGFKIFRVPLCPPCLKAREGNNVPNLRFYREDDYL